MTVVENGCIIVSSCNLGAYSTLVSTEWAKRKKGGIAIMFKGTFEHQLDDKNRLRIPSRFKKELTGELESALAAHVKTHEQFLSGKTEE